VSSGVTQVRFADGSEWTYPLESKGRFEKQEDEKIAQKVHALKEQWKVNVGAVFSPDEYKNVSTCRTSTEEPIPAKVRIPE
jgi:ATP sulfurylase